ncbi:flagellin [Fulvimarina sp. 2208YS6-2-32]|uniref:Flagellin n=1 Tax=Fulvimarina uroteuthidis TaxID=3098149 RepID=A0ABU5I132_9HYPH|nr:flagellin [Fulvimarina sp. 2208YS6-2-32]MDY8109057.1 flagellin [Fulvimarina sp. 2208YS6-2-32]
MTSINTNVAAMTALQNLQMTNNMMEETQNRISTGFRVGDAKDNAAYWSIATTMRSDNRSLSAVTDALGLGAATVDTAYTGMTSVKDVLVDIKAKLTAATQDGVDRSKVQSEVSELQKQMKSIADSASFSGANWLSVNSGAASYSSETSIVSSFSRMSSGSISLGSVNISVDDLKLYDANSASDPTKAGILDRQIDLVDRNGNKLDIGGTSSKPGSGTGGLKAQEATAGKSIATAGADFAGPLTFDELGDKISFNVNIVTTDAQGVPTTKTTAVTIARGTVQTALDNSADAVSITTASEYVKVVQQALIDAGIPGVNVGTAPGTGAGGTILTYTSDKGTVSITGATGANGSGPSGTDLTTATLALDATATTYQPAVATMDAFKSPMQLTGDANIKFSIGVDGAATPTPVTIDKATISRALGTTDGKINSAYEFQRVVLAALADPAGDGSVTAIANVTVGSLANGAVTFTSQNTSATSAISISAVTTKKDGTNSAASTSAQISIADIDVSDKAFEERGATTTAQINDVLLAYINVVDQAIESVTTAASNLGSITNRIEMQRDFLSKLTDTIDKGIGTLVDADMTEESTKLKALQTQQQLGVQALSIANASSQSIMQLFQG